MFILSKKQKVNTMGTQYKLTSDIDLTFDDIITLNAKDQAKIAEKLVPTVTMQAKFMQNCLEMGILTTI